MQSYIEKEHADLVSESAVVSDDREWYLPHFLFLNSKKPSKLRIVFDCAAKHMGISLNDVFMQRPDLVNSLVGVLTRFREEHVALVAHIEAMLHQVRVRVFVVAKWRLNRKPAHRGTSLWSDLLPELLCLCLGTESGRIR